MNKTNLQKNLFKTFLENRILSRWFVLFIDLTIVTVSTFFSYLITLQIYKSIPGLTPPVLHKYLIFTVGCTFVFFLLLKTYIGIIRYSTVFEFMRCFTALFLSVVCVFFYLFLLKGSSGSISLGYCLTFLLFSLLGLFLFRIFVISSYRYLKRKYSDKIIEVFLWGVDENTISMSNVLNSSQSGYKVKGLIEDGHYSKLGKNTNLPIVTKKYRVKNVLFLSERTLKDNQSVAEELIKRGVHLYIMQDVNINNLDELKEASNTIRPIQIEDLLGRPEIKISKDFIRQNVSNKTILVTGAAGSIGSEIVRQLAKFDPKLVLCLDQAETPLHALSLELENSSLNHKLIVADIRNYNKLKVVFEELKPDIVYHAAAYKHVPLMEKEPSEAIITNVQGTKYMVNLSIKYNVEMFVMISTDKAVNPTNIMGASKRIAEIYVQTCALDPEVQKKARTKFVTTRFGNVLGSNGSVIPLFKEQIAKGGPIKVTHKDITRYFMTIPEACRLVLEASVIGSSGYIYIFDMGEPVRIYDLAKKMIELAGLKLDEDIKIEFSGLRPGEKLYEELLNNSELTEETSHHKIKVAKVRQYNLGEVAPKLDHLIFLAKECDTDSLVRCMKDLVPEFKSQNSVYEIFDIEDSALELSD